MKIKILYIILIFSVSFLEAQNTWSSTSFEYYWNRTFNRIQFREPQSFTPLEIRIGQLSYGGEKYWNQNFFDTNNSSSIAILDSTELSYPDLNKIESRQALFIEIDVIKLNLFNYLYYQNFLDVQFGLGYRNIRNINAVPLPEHWIKVLPNNESLGEYSYSPNINNFNYNITASYQFSHYFISYLYYNFGYSFGNIYKSSGGENYLSAQGISEGLSLGLKYMVNPKGLEFSFTYGIDARFQRTTLFDIDDPRKISHIDQLNLYSKGIFFTLSTTFGGRKSSGDIAYRKMLNGDYISAIFSFEKYILDFPNSNKMSKAEEMLLFCSNQVPYQQFDSALFYFDKQQFLTAIKWIEIAYENADSSLLSEINLYKQKLAISIIEEIDNNETFSNSENIYKQAIELSPEYFLIKEIFSNFYINKGDKVLNDMNYDLAYEYYKKAVQLFPNHRSRISNRYPKLIRGLINDANLATDGSDYVLAKYSIDKIIEIDPRYKSEFVNILNEINNNINNTEKRYIDRKIKEFIFNKSNNRKEIMDHELELGMTKDEVLELIDEPDIQDSSIRGERMFEMWTYNNKSNIKRLFFENNFLIKVER